MKKLVTVFGLLLAVSALVLTACGSSGDSTDSSSTGTFQEDGYPFTFEYPGDWQPTTDTSLNQQLGSSSASNVKGIGIDDTNIIAAATYSLNIPVSQDNIDQAKADFDKLVQKADPSADGIVGTTGGFPSLKYESIPVTNPAGATNTLVFLFDGTSEYQLTCQWDSDHADEVQAACDQMQSTLTKTG